ncbi:Potassium voltage-gated channel protein eag (Ether-a-go-go protein) [Durusdinium trenchii]|uniref:Potassium voltage-gated channel protein eag (Ether-a-go-go protein) n=1 Tax=Durusdinium trenchii TaxID=1381693 RepID=A0ABP0Q803_9DINO
MAHTGEDEQKMEAEDPAVDPLDAVQTLRAEFDIYAARLREKLVSLEKNLSTQATPLAAASAQQANPAPVGVMKCAKCQQMDASQASHDPYKKDYKSGGADVGGRSHSLTDAAWEAFAALRWTSKGSGDMSGALPSATEPPALAEHRISRHQQQVTARTLRRHISVGPIHSLRSDLATDFRLHNRWLQLSMQSDSTQAIAEIRNAAKMKPSAVSARPSLKNVTRSGLAHLFLRSLHPGGQLRMSWDTIGILLLFLDAVLLPVSLAWNWQKDTTGTSSLLLLGLFITGVVFWTLDIVLNFHTSYFDKGILITSQRMICKHYLSTWFFLDLCLVALDYVTAVHTLVDSLTDLSATRFARMLRITRLVRLAKMAKLEGILSEYAASTGRQWAMLVVTLMNTITVTVLIQHMASCLWFGIGQMDENNWISLSEVAYSSPVVQYLHAFRYVMLPVSPPRMDPENLIERGFDILYAGFWVVILGSSITRISFTMIELFAMNESKSKQRREIRRYLRTQEASFQLVSRVMNFVDYKLDKLSLINFDHSLISNTLQTELCVNQRSRYLEAVPIFKVTRDLFPDLFATVCTLLKKMVCETGEEVFVSGSYSTCLYITITGSYIHVEAEKDEAEELTGIQGFEELSLYVENLHHQDSLFARTFAELYYLEGAELVNSLQNSPGCAGMFFEYAREFTTAVQRASAGGKVDRRAQLSIAKRCCKMTRVYQELFPDQKFKFDNIVSSSEELRNFRYDENSPYEGAKRGIAWLLKEGWLEDLEESTLPTQLRSSLPELHPETGCHMIFEQPLDRDRAESSCISILALIANRYEIFTRPQEPSARLRRQQWEQLQEVISWVRPTTDEVHAVLVLLAIRALGKSKFVLCQVPSHNRRPESAVLYLVEHSSNVVPSINQLSEYGLKCTKRTLLLHEAFNFAQLLQGENVPANVLQLQAQVMREGEQAIRFYILFLLGFMSGLEGGSGSRFMTAQRAENVIEAVNMLQHLSYATPAGIYWGYLCARAQALRLPTEKPEDLVLIRLAFLMRVQTDDNCYEELKTAWNRLGDQEKRALTNHFLADGIEETAVVFEFLPDCVANAVKNPVVTLTGLLEILEELLHTLQPALAMNPDLQDAKVIQVDLSDMSEFISVVNNHFVFETCVSRCKIRFAGRRAQLEMTAGNWGRIHEQDSDLQSLSYSVRDLMQRQQYVESHLLKLEKPAAPQQFTTFSI